jgi:hypothetical protein
MPLSNLISQNTSSYPSGASPNGSPTRLPRGNLRSLSQLPDFPSTSASDGATPTDIPQNGTMATGSGNAPLSFSQDSYTDFLMSDRLSLLCLPLWGPSSNCHRIIFISSIRSNHWTISTYLRSRTNHCIFTSHTVPSDALASFFVLYRCHTMCIRSRIRIPVVAINDTILFSRRIAGFLSPFSTQFSSRFDVHPTCFLMWNPRFI